MNISIGKIKFNILFICFYFIIDFSAYSINIDSLKKHTVKLSDEELVDAYLQIAQYSFELNNDLDSMLVYSKLAYKKSIKLQYGDGVVTSLTYSAIAYSRLGEMDKSNQNLNEAIKVARLLHDEESIGDLEGKIGYNFHVQGDYQNAIIHYLKATEIMERLSNYSGLSTTYGNIAMVFNTLKQDDECLFYIRKSLSQNSKHNNDYIKVIAYSAAMNEMLDVGINSRNYIDSALVYAKLGLEIAIKNDFKQRIALFYTQMSEIFDQKNNQDEARNFFLKAMEYRPYLTQSHLRVYYFRAIRFHSSLNHNAIALSYIDSVFKSMEGFENDYYYFRVYEESYVLNKKQGNSNKALSDHENLRIYESKLLDEKRNKQVNTLQQKFNQAQNEKTIDELNKDKEILFKNNQIDNLKINILFIGIILLLMILLLIFFIYRQNQIRQRSNLLEVELRLNRSRINPHFFFNALTSIQTLIKRSNASDQINFYISKFSKIMRASLESTYVDLISLEEEMIFLEEYMNIQKFYHDNKFSFIFDLSDNIHSNEIYVPSMILQPFIENSIEHGFKYIEEGGVIKVKIVATSSELIITVTDNGRWEVEATQHKSYTSRATQIIKDRLFLINKKYKSKASFSLAYSPAGTIVNITLPLIFNV